MQKRIKYTEDCCVNSIISAFVFFYAFTNLNYAFFSRQAKKTSKGTKNRQQEYSINERHINASCVHDILKSGINSTANVST